MVTDTAGKVMIVAPDKIGDQRGTIEVQEKYAFRINSLIDRGASLIVPIQKGRLSPLEAFSLTIDMLGTDDFGVAVPSNKEAFSEDDLRDLLSGKIKPKHIHFLGMTTANKMFPGKKAIVQELSPGTTITMDGNRINAKVGQGRPITIKQVAYKKAQTKEYFEQIVDETKEWRIPEAKAGQGPYKQYEDGGDYMIELLGTEIEHEELRELMETIAPWDCMYSPETLVDIYMKNGPESNRLKAALGPDWLDDDLTYVTLQKIASGHLEQEIEEDAQVMADMHSSEIRSHSVCESMLEDPNEFDFEEDLILPGMS